MGNKKKVNKNSEVEKGVKKKCKKNKSLEKTNELNEDVSDPSKIAKSVIVEERNKNKERRNKKITLSNDKEFDNLYNGESEDTSMNNPNPYVHQKNSSKNKLKKRKLEEEVGVTDIDPPKFKNAKPEKNKDQESKTEIQSENKINVLEDSSVAREKTVNKIKHQFLNADEAEVKDEDIDKFCDDITEEDNETYENWIKLFEVNFKKNKKTAK